MKPASSPGATSRPLTPVDDVLGGGGAVERHHRQPGGERLHDDVAEGVGEAREEERVGRGVVRRQLGAALGADEAGRRVGGGEPVAGRAVADHDHAQLGLVAAGPLEGTQRQLDVLLGGDPADREQHRRARPGLPLRAQRVAACGRREALAVDAAADDGEMVEARRAELAPGRLGRHEGEPRQVVEAPHQAERGRRRAGRGRSGGCTGGNWCGNPRSWRCRGRARPGAPPRAAGRASPGAPGRAGSRGSAAAAGPDGPGRSAGRDTSGSRSRRCAARRRHRGAASPGWRGRISSTRWPRERRNRTVRSTVRDTPFSSGGQVSVT